MKEDTKVIVRSKSAGVFYGTFADFVRDHDIVALKDCRRIWRWSGAASLNQLSTDGTSDPENCRITKAVESIEVGDVVEVILCSDKASRSIEGVKVWEIES